MVINFPAEISCAWSDERLLLKYPLPKIWTQKSSRAFGIYWSEALSYGRLWPVPTDEELSAFYNLPVYDDYLSGKKKAGGAPTSLLSRICVKLAYLNDRGAIDSVPSIIELAPGKEPSICDIGCGSGSFLRRMSGLGAKSVGIDPSPMSGEALRSQGIEYHHGTAEVLPKALDGRKFDVVSMFQSLEHCRDPAVAIRNALSLLKARGLLIVDVPNMECLGFERYGQAWFHTDAGRHLQFFTKKSLDILLSAEGARPMRWEFQGFVSQFTPDWIGAMAAVWDSLFSETGARFAPPPRPSLRNSMAYFPRAILSADRLKYEIIRVYARLK
jgi:2-polyprenyl-3-methyl-5-hydroxy-6-metoxy-1,4-benzoquinol methylase